MIILYNGESHNVRISILQGQSDNLENFCRAQVKVLLIGNNDKIVLDHEYKNDRIYATLPSHIAPAVYTIQVLWAKNTKSLKTLHVNSGCYNMAIKQNAFAVTDTPTEATNIASGQIVDIRMHAATYGYDGLNAWELAVLREDTYLAESEWIQVRMGAIQESQIADGAVTERKIADNAVSERTIDNNAVTTPKIADKAVTTDKLEDYVPGKLDSTGVTTDKIADKAVTTLKIADKAVTKEKIDDDAIDTSKLADGSVTTTKIGDKQVTTPKIADKAVTTPKIADKAISERTIDDNAVTEGKIQNNAVSERTIGTDAVTETKIKDNAVTTPKIKDDAVTEQKIKNGQVTTPKLAPNSVTNDKLAENAVVAGNIAPDAVENRNIADDAVQEGNIAPAAVTETKIKDGQVTENKIGEGAVTENKIGEGAVTESKIDQKAVTEDKLADGAVTNEKLADGAITDEKIAPGSLQAYSQTVNNRLDDTDGKLSELERVVGKTSIPVTGEGYIETSGSVINPENIIVDSSGYRYSVLSVTEGDIVTINGIGGGKPRLWVFAERNWAALNPRADANATAENLELVVPKKAVWLVINDKSDSTSYIERGAESLRIYKADKTYVDKLNAEVNKDLLNTKDLLTEISDLSVINFSESGKYIATKTIGSVVSFVPVVEPSNMRYAIIDCQEGDKFLLNVTGGGTPRAWCFVDINDVAISNSAASASLTDYVLVAPANATKLILNDNSGRMSYKGTDRIGRIEKNTLSNTENIALLDSRTDDNRSQIEALGNFEKAIYPSETSTVADLLLLEKTQSIHHDNFWRDDNSSDIGFNGHGKYTMEYEDMATSAVESENIQVGIQGHKAVSFNPNGASSSARRLKVRDVGQFPYKISAETDNTGVIAIAPESASNYHFVRFTKDKVSFGHSTSSDSIMFEHNSDCKVVTIYVYFDHISIYIAGVKVIEEEFAPANTKCGLAFTTSDAIRYMNFDIFIPAQNIDTGLDRVIEETNTPTSELLGLMNTADPTYGILYDRHNVKNSIKSIRFEQRFEDSIGQHTYRSEITPLNPRDKDYCLQSKIVEYDIFYPEDYDYDSYPDVQTQQHNTPDHINLDGLYPNISIITRYGHMYLERKTSADRKLLSPDDIESETFDLGELVKGRWQHVVLYLREGYMQSQNPCLALWIDGQLRYMSRKPNAYNTTFGSYLKMGMYKATWKNHATETNTRVVWFDNVRIWM